MASSSDRCANCGHVFDAHTDRAVSPPCEGEHWPPVIFGGHDPGWEYDDPRLRATSYWSSVIGNVFHASDEHIAAARRDACYCPGFRRGTP